MKYNKTMTNVISVDDHQMISFGLDKVFSETKDIRLASFFKTKAELERYIVIAPVPCLFWKSVPTATVIHRFPLSC